MLTIGVMNESTVVTDTEVQACMAAVESQINTDVAMHWNVEQVTFQFMPKGSPAGGDWAIMHVLDNSDQADALGYHEVQNDQPVGFVFAKTCIDAKTSWTVCFSHESIELVGDPRINSVKDDADTKFYALELCDPCEDDSLGYMISVNEGAPGILVSDFVLEAWFDPSAKGPYTHRNTIPAPLTLAKGGYCSYFDIASKQWSQATNFKKVSARAIPTHYSRRGRRMGL